MRYSEALRKSFVGMLTCWRQLPAHFDDFSEAAGDAIVKGWWVVFILLAPFFFWLSPLVAWCAIKSQKPIDEALEQLK